MLPKMKSILVENGKRPPSKTNGKLMRKNGKPNKVVKFSMGKLVKSIAIYFISMAICISRANPSGI